MNNWKEQLEEEVGDCPEKERFLDSEDFMKGYGYWPSKSECIRNYSTGECEGSCGQSFLDETTLYLFGLLSKEHGFAPFEMIKEENDKGKHITVKETVVGFYVDENKHSGFVHWKTNRDLLPEKFRTNIEKLAPIDKFYFGETYTLIKQGDHSFALSSNLLRNIKQVISTVNSEYSFFVQEYQATPDGTLLGLLMNDNSLFIIAMMLGFVDYVEEERTILMEKVDYAQPFFTFEPYKKICWTKLKEPKGTYFEALCEILLSKQKNIMEVQPIGKTNASDRGRDFIVIENSRDLSGSIIKLKWLVQCKYSENSINNKTVPDWTNRVLEHNVDGYWLVTNNDITPDLYDQLKDASQNPKLKIETRIWQRNKFDTIFNTNPELFTKDIFE